MAKKKLEISVSGIDFDDLESAAVEAARQAGSETCRRRFDVKFKHFAVLVHDQGIYKDYVFSVSYETEW